MRRLFLLVQIGCMQQGGLTHKFHFLSVGGRRRTDKLVKDPVKLGKGKETAGKGDLCDGSGSGHQHGLGISDSGHLDVFCDVKSCNPFELMRQVIIADVEFRGQHIQG